jgi:hypothetical protein
MTQHIGSREREGQAYLSYHQDGLLDLLVGLGLLLSGIYLLADLDVPLGAVWVVLWLPIWLAAKKSITARRCRDLQISDERDAGLMRAALFGVSVLVLLVGAVLVLLWGRNSGLISEGFISALGQNAMWALGLLAALVFSVAAWLSGLKRLYAYGLLTAVAFVGGYLLGARFALAMTAVATVVAAWGAVLLIRFVRTHPIQQA